MVKHLTRTGISVAAVLFVVSLSSLYAETIVLKSGQTLEGNITEKTDKFITIDYEGVSLSYAPDEIERIEGEKSPATAGGTSPEAATNVAGLEKIRAELEQCLLDEKYEDALPLLQEVSRLTPNNSNVQITLGLTKFFLNRPEESISSFKQVLRSDQKIDYRTHLYVGLIYNYMGSKKEAEEEIKKYIELCKENRDLAGITMGRILLKK